MDGFIIGAQKGGSTSLDRYLASHPEVLAARHEVPALEDPVFAQGGVAKAEQWVAQHRRPEHRRVVLRRPNYLCVREVPGRMHQVWPQVRLVAVLRDPIERAVSAYFHYMRYGLTAVRDVNQGLLELLDSDVADSTRESEILRFGCYGSALGRWLEFFPRSELLLLDSDALRHDPAGALGRVAEHFGINREHRLPDIRPGMPGSYGMGHVRARNAVMPTLYARSVDDRLTPRWVLPQIYDRAERILWPDKTRQPELDVAVRRRLIDYYRPEVEKLQDVLRSGLPPWVERYV